MSLELIAILATSAFEMGGLIFLGILLYRTRSKVEADDAALYLQGHRIEQVLKEMRAELTKK